MNETKTYVEWNDTIENALKERVVYITFEKRDGGERKMTCTLNPARIPTEKHPSGARVYDQSVVRRVYDLNKEDWRSINKNRVIKWEIA
jgi:hypothetical protein